MRSLTSRQKLILSVALYFSLFLVLLSLIFISIFRLTLTNQVRSDIYQIVEDVVTHHVVVRQGRLVFVKNNGLSLREELLRNNLSGLFLNSQLQLVRGYGLFEIYRQSDERNIAPLLELARESQKQKAVLSSTVSWSDEQILLFVSPIVSQGKFYGVALIGKNFNQLEVVNRSLWLVFFALGGVSLAGIVFLSSVLVKQTLMPIRGLVEQIESIDLHNLRSRVQPEGHPADDAVILIRKFNEMLARLEEMSIQQNEFISNASHELKTPLTRAISSLEVKLYDAPHSADFALIRNDLLDLASLIDQLLLLSKLKRNNPLRSQASLKKTILMSLQKFGEQINEKQLKLNLELDEILVWVPKNYLMLVFDNLLANAVKYNRQGGKLVVKTGKTQAGVWVNIVDNGQGIKSEDRRKIFDRFFRGQTRAKVSGHGIGLSLVKRVTDIYNIEIKVLSEWQEGTSISLFFPYDQPREAK